MESKFLVKPITSLSVSDAKKAELYRGKAKNGLYH